MATTSFKTSSLSWPHMFNVVQNTVSVFTDANAVSSRSKLLILTEPTEIYNEPNQGVGLRKHMFKYNNENERAIIRDQIVDQLRLHEPQCVPEHTKFVDGLIYSGSTSKESMVHVNKLEMTVTIETVFGALANISIESD